MADRFDEMARAWCAEHVLAVDDQLAALLRKVHDEVIDKAADLFADDPEATNMDRAGATYIRDRIRALKAGGK